VKRYLDHVRLIRGSALATTERSHYPALDTNYQAVKANTLALGEPSPVAAPVTEA